MRMENENEPRNNNLDHYAGAKITMVRLGDINELRNH